MIGLFSLLIATTILPSPDQEVLELLRPPSKAAVDEAKAFIEELSHPPKGSEKKCSFGAHTPELPRLKGSMNGKLLVFISFSVPIETWKEHSYFLEKIGGCFVLRGLPENSFTVFSQKLLELNKAGIYAEVLLDPPSFEQYEIEIVPALVSVQENRHDIILGNLTIPRALSLFADKGDTKDLSQQLLKRLEEN